MAAGQARARFPYAEADHESIPCNLCGGTDVETICRTDRNLLPVTTVICKHDGFVFISPRMTPLWYSRYYDGEYRRQMAAYHQLQAEEETRRLEHQWQSQRRHGRWLADYLRRCGVTKLGSVLEIGSSSGGILKVLGEEFGASIFGVEPSSEEAAFASARGVPTRVGLFEALDFGDERFDLIICTQTFNHLLDPKQSAERARALLSPKGLFFLEVMDFFALCELQGALFNAVQIDHVSMFVPATMKAMCEAVGMEVLPETVLCDREQSKEDRRARREAGAAWLHARFLAKPGAPKPPPATYAEIRAELGKIKFEPLKTYVKLKLRPYRPFARKLPYVRWRVDRWLQFNTTD